MSGKKVVLLMGLAIGICMISFVAVILTQREAAPVSELEGKPSVKCAGLALGTGEGQRQALRSLLTGFNVTVPGMEEVFSGRIPLVLAGAGPLPGQEGGHATWLELAWSSGEGQESPSAYGVRLLCVDGVARSVTAIRVPSGAEGVAIAEVLPLEQRGESGEGDARAMWRRRCSTETQGGIEARFCQVEAHAPGALQIFMPALRYVAFQRSQPLPELPLQFSSDLKQLVLSEGQLSLVMEVSLTYPRLDATCLEAEHFRLQGASLIMDEGCTAELGTVVAECSCGPFPAVLPPKGLREPVLCGALGASPAGLCRQISATIPLDVAIANHLD